MKKHLLKIVSAVLTGVMLVGTAVPAMADIVDIQVIDLASAPMVASEGTTETYPTPKGTDIKINIVDEDGNQLGENKVDTSRLVAGKFAKISADDESSGKQFSHYEYVTTARNYVASYDKEFTFYVDPPMTINVVYADKVDHAGDIIISGMYKDPTSDGTNTFFYCAVAGAKGNSTTADITFGRSQKDESDIDNNSETFKTETDQNICDPDDKAERGSFQYIVSSAIQTGGPIDFEAKGDGIDSTALIKTWDLHSGAFYGKTNGTVNGLNIDGDTYSFNANIGDKVRVYTTDDSALSVEGLEESKKSSDGKINEYTATAIPVIITGSNIEKIMVNPMDIAITDDGQPNTPSPDKATTGTITVNVKATETENPLSGATVTASKDNNTVTIPETGEGIYSLSVPAGDYNINVELNGITATGSITAENGQEKSVTIFIKDIEAERQKKINTLIDYMQTVKKPDTEGTLWNTESPKELKWSYINGCMMTAFMDLYDVTDDAETKQKYLDFVINYEDKSIASDGEIKTKKDVTQSGGFTNKSLTSDSTLDNVNPGKALLDLIETGNAGTSNKFSLCVNEQITKIVDNASKTRVDTDKNFWHKSNYPHQVWLDGTYMALPYMIQYKRIYPDDSYTIAGHKTAKDTIDDVVNQFKNVEAKMKDKKTGLYYHGYDAQADSTTYDYEEKGSEYAMSWASGSSATNSPYKIGGNHISNVENKGCSSNFWSRAMGWYAMALIDSYEQINLIQDGNDYSSQKGELARIFKDLMTSVLKYQDPETGMWYQVMDNKENEPCREYNYLESSGTATFAAALMKGYNLGLLDESYYEKGLKAFNGITDNQLTIDREDQNKAGIGNICKSAGFAGVNGNSKSNEKTKFADGETSPLKGTPNEHLYRDGSFEYYLTEPVVSNDAKGAAPYLMAYAQKLQHDKNLQNKG